MSQVKQPRIFLGVVDIAGQIGDYRSGYENLGLQVFTMVFDRNPQYPDRRYSFVLYDLYPRRLLKPTNLSASILRKVFSFLVVTPAFYIALGWAALKCDIFQLMWITDERWKYILPALKILKKKVVVNFVGSDIRYVPRFIQELDMLGLDHHDNETLMKNTISQQIAVGQPLRTLRVAERHANLILSSPDQAQLALRPYSNFAIPLRYSDITFNPSKSNPQPVLVHANTERNIYGTNAVLDAIEKAKQMSSVPFDFILLEGKSNSEVLEILSKSDIVVYSPYMQGPGKFGLEALAAGCVLLTGHDPQYIRYPRNPPIVNVTAENLNEKLLYYIGHDEERTHLAAKGRLWVEENFNLEKICLDILKKLDESNEQPDYIPEFFRNHATFNSKWDSPDAVTVCNRWTRYVSDCPWYNVHVPPGDRAGLRF